MGHREMAADPIRRALGVDRTIDIVTVGAKTGLSRTTEIWFIRIGGSIYICGTPSGDGSDGRPASRDWLANLRKNPDFQFCLKESMMAQLSARATEVVDADRRREIMSAPETSWYRDRVASVDDLVQGSPIVAVEFTGDFTHLNSGNRW